MREIKFRAWDKEYKVLRNVTRVNFTIGKISLCENTGYFNYTCDIDEVILMQYTGLKDKNGKEIYEGDIIRESDGDGGYIYAKVVYYKDGFMGKEKGFEPEYPISDFQNEVEVIGNIYENPELSEVEK